MLSTPTTFIGIDPTAALQPFTFAALDADCRLLALAAGELDEALAFFGRHEAATVAVNAPSAPNIGLVKKKLEAQNPMPGHGSPGSGHHLPRGAEMRLAEYELRQRGILLSSTPGRAESCPEWMQLGFMLYHRLAGLGFVPYPAENAPRQWLETHPHAAFCALLGQAPLPKPSLEGRLQRQLALYELGVGVKDPMNFFEEITRRRLLKGILPLEVIHTPEQLDALAAAYTAYAAANHPEELLLVGAPEEGQIVLPR
jgi:hypothetical protein